MKSHGLLVSAFSGGSGKTVVSSLLMRALSKHFAIQPFKVGPDYIDPSFHKTYSGQIPYNLDLYFKDSSEIQRLIHSFDGIGVIEGMSGLFDGIQPNSDQGSTIDLARQIHWPILLVIDANTANRSTYAAIKGFVEEAKPAIIAGLIINNLYSEGQQKYLNTALEKCNIPILGNIFHHTELKWPERHLGLKPSVEFSLTPPENLDSILQKELNLPLLLELLQPQKNRLPNKIPKRQALRKIGIAQDEAFSFYYRDSLEFLQEEGFELIPFSPLHDKQIPNVDSLFLGGGFPEIFLEQLSSNKDMLLSISTFYQQGGYIYAECGGFMLLAETISTDTQTYLMAGLISGNMCFTKQLQHFGYSYIKHPMGILKGHEFHYTKWELELEKANLWTVNKASFGASRKEGYSQPRLHASFIHLSFRESKEYLRGFFDLVPIEK